MAELIRPFLHTWTIELAWWLGATLGDGNVFSEYGNHRISIVGSLSTTTRWLALIAAPGATEPYERPNSPGTYEAYIYSKELVEWFRARGICGAKSHALEWPEDLPAELTWHFLRGLWDTDGSLGIEVKKKRGTGNDAPWAHYSSACEGFVYVVRERVMGVAGVESVKVSKKVKMERGKTFYQYAVKWSSAPAMRVADALYGAAPGHLVNDDRLAVYREQCALRVRLAGVVCPGVPAAPGGEPVPCGAPARKEGLCTRCWWAGRPRKNAQVSCPCGNVAWKKGMCSSCYHKARRTAQKGE